MIINKGATNSLCFTLNELKTLTNPYYIFKLTNIERNSDKIFYSSNLSINKDRYDLFDIGENDTEDLLNGVVSLYPGQYYYNVYESSTISLTSSYWTGLVETGRLLVKEVISTTSYTDEATDIATYRS